jgi:hypothetical protein
MVRSFFSLEKCATVKDLHVQKWASVYVSFDSFGFVPTKELMTLLPVLKTMILEIFRYTLGPGASGPFNKFNKRKANFVE